MRSIFLIFTLLSLAAAAQTTASITASEVLVTSPPVQASTSTPSLLPDSDLSSSEKTTYLDYKSVYAAATLEEEVKMATERFRLSPDQQELWLSEATDRRIVEKQAQEKIEKKSSSFELEPVYRGLRMSQNNFYNIIISHMNPAQKQAFETDRLVLQEKQQRLAKLPPTPPPAPTVTLIPVDSAAIKANQEVKMKEKVKKKKKK